MSIHFCRTNKFDLEVLIYHLKEKKRKKADALISKESLTPADLDQLKRYTLLWREGFKMSFSRNCDKERDKLTSERSKASESSQKRKRFQQAKHHQTRVIKILMMQREGKGLEMKQTN